MSTYGRFSSFWSVEDINKVIELILDSWKSFKIPSKFEDRITNKFCAHLRTNKDRSKHFFSIEPQSCTLDDVGEVLGKIDLKFSIGYEEMVYFSFECKRLRVHFPSGFDTLASEYVTEGMYRYFNGQYAQGLDKGGMLGYVMDGNIDEAIQNVKAAIENRRHYLHMESDDTLRRSSCLSSKHVKETFHNYGPKNQFVIYHIFLSVITSLNKN
jgi:hypothetical protein